jgi:predicted transcriptional regulator of viral defense system
MEFGRLLEIVGAEPVFETGLLLAGAVNPQDVRRQLTRWTRTGRLYQLRRGVYALAPPYQKRKPHPFLVANRLVRPSYVTTQAALAYYDMIPEFVPMVTSVTTGRPGRWATPLGIFDYRHVSMRLWRGFRQVEVNPGQTAFIASPEKALLDLIYLQPGGDARAFLQELRLQNLEQVNRKELERLAVTPKLRRAAAHLADLAAQERDAFETL